MILNKDVTSGVGSAIISIMLLIGSRNIEKLESTVIGAGFMPKIISITLLIMSVLLIVTGLKKGREEKKNDVLNYKGVIAIIISMIIYAMALKPIGFIITSCVFLFVALRLMSKPEEVNNKKFIILSLVATIAINFIFTEIFGIRIPQGII